MVRFRPLSVKGNKAAWRYLPCSFSEVLQKKLKEVKILQFSQQFLGASTVRMKTQRSVFIAACFGSFCQQWQSVLQADTYMSINDFDLRKSQTQKVEGNFSPSHLYVENHPNMVLAQLNTGMLLKAMLCSSFLLTLGTTETEKLLKHSSIYPKPGVCSLGELEELEIETQFSPLV